MEFLDTILRNITWPLTAFFGGITSLIISIIVFREQLARLISKLPQPLAQLLSNISFVKATLGKHAIEIEFGRRVNHAKAQARGIEETVAASRSMPAPNLLRETEKQTARDIVLASWGALRQSVYDACTASKLPLTPVTRIPEAVRRLADAKAINADLVKLIHVLYELGQELANDTALKPQEDDARVYKELSEVVVEWLMLNLLSPASKEMPPPVHTPEARRKTVVGGHFSHPHPGHPVAFLVGTSGSLRGQRFSIEKDHYRIGRNADNDLRITRDDYISGNHAYLLYEKGSLFLADQGSRNGTFLNDKQVTASPVMVRWGDYIRLGDSVFQVVEASR